MQDLEELPPPGAKRLHWESSPTEFESADLDSLLRYLDRYPTVFGTQRVAQDVLLKRCMDVGKTEFQNQTLAWRLCDPTVLYVPKPLRYFQSQDEHRFQQSNILMEFVHGRTVEDLLTTGKGGNLEVVCAKVFAAVRHLQEVSRGLFSKIGSLHSLETTGFPWAESTVKLGSLEDLKNNIRQRCGGQEAFLYTNRLATQAAVLCHLDLVPRNMMLKDEDDKGSLVILDWATMANYPPTFELGATLWWLQCTDDERLCEMRERLATFLEQSSETNQQDAILLHLSVDSACSLPCLPDLCY